jgi:signal peptidase I
MLNSGRSNVTVRTNAMWPIIKAGDQVSVQEVPPEQIHRGDVIAFARQNWGDESGPIVVSRVLGIGGDTVSCCNGSGKLVVNSKEITEDYLPKNDANPDPTPAYGRGVYQGMVFVAGDSRADSQDSRQYVESDSGRGLVPLKDIRGIVVSVGKTGIATTSAFVDAGLPGDTYDSGKTTWVFIAGIVAGFVLAALGAAWLLVPRLSRTKG